MPDALISLCDSGQFFRVQYGDFVTIVAGELRNYNRLQYAVLIVAGTDPDEHKPTDAPFPNLFPDEPVWYAECRLPVGVANCAALLATGFQWTSEAASAAKECRVSAAVVKQIREGIDELHREYDRLLRGFPTRLATDHPADDTDAPPLAEYLRVEDLRIQGVWKARVAVNCQAADAEEYKIPPEAIAPAPRSEVKKPRKWWWFWKSS